MGLEYEPSSEPLHISAVWCGAVWCVRGVPSVGQSVTRGQPPLDQTREGRLTTWEASAGHRLGQSVRQGEGNSVGQSVGQSEGQSVG